MAGLPSVYPNLRFRQDNIGCVLKDKRVLASAPCKDELLLGSGWLCGLTLVSVLAEVAAHWPSGWMQELTLQSGERPAWCFLSFLLRGLLMLVSSEYICALALESGSQCGNLPAADQTAERGLELVTLVWTVGFSAWDSVLLPSVYPQFYHFRNVICYEVLRDQSKYTYRISIQSKNKDCSMRGETFCQCAFKVLFCRIKSTMLEKAIHKHCFPLSLYCTVNSLVDLTFPPLLENIHLLYQYWSWIDAEAFKCILFAREIKTTNQKLIRNNYTLTGLFILHLLSKYVPCYSRFYKHNSK